MTEDSTVGDGGLETVGDGGLEQPAAADLAALGLPAAAARVLGQLGREGWTTSVALAAALGLSRPAVSDAVDVLVKWGLVERTRGRRPAPLRLHPRAELALDARLEDLERQQEERAQRGAGWVREAAAAARERPAPVREIAPAGAPPDYLLATCRRSYDEVCRPSSGTVLFSGAVTRRHVQRRLIVLGDPPAERGRWLLRAGVVLRTTGEQLPLLLLADDERARVEVSADGRSARSGWTHDPAQVRALRQLFELWWEQAQPWQV